ncbi:hypothetical protein ESOMN_v1c04180 [Williamsoniiplasma somnilux]|uniref:Uncharacterized protein n=1 Tax=Williamsoniiplasma somnilux TaxID=215578 RepID=A0A2K8NYA4_9MOLU|nr:hypothetical protein [Williamsoniiplasma somnilux]ATZ18800.1 hypothetical protein ESOMN_v1c04180 [Williamsoniiplasma somnilux]
MYRFKSIRYIVEASMILAILVILSLTTLFFKINDTTFQITDGLYLVLCALVPGPMMLVVGISYSTIIDLISGGFIFIPITITIHILMFCVVKILKKPISPYLSFIVAALLIFIYVFYVYLLNLNLGHLQAQNVAIKELITDSIQFGISIIISFVLYFFLSKKNIKTILFNDNKYNSFKSNKSRY